MQHGALPAEWRAGGGGGNAPAAPQGEATGSDIGALQPDGAADAAVDVGEVTEDREEQRGTGVAAATAQGVCTTGTQRFGKPRTAW